MNDIVISLCDRTGNMVKPWAEAGFECFCFDTAHPIRAPRFENGIHYLWGDARTVKRPRGHIIAAFAFPPCTDLARSGAQDFTRKGGHLLRDALEIFEACRQVCEWSGAPYAIENPIGVLSSIPHIGKPDFYYDPFDYTAFELSDHYTKRTCLWTGNGFVMPPKARPPALYEVEPDHNRILGQPEAHGRRDIRSTTPLGFARAVFQCNAPKAAAA